MNFSEILEALYTKVFINIIVGDSQTTVYVEVCSKDDVTSHETKIFATTAVNAEMLSFVKSSINKSPYHYISVLDKSANKGAIPSCTNITKYLENTAVHSICVDEKWAFYTPKDDIKEIKYEYQSIGLDFIFSPFSILTKFFKDKIDKNLSIFLLIEDNGISLCVFKKGDLLYAQYLDMGTKSLGSEDLMLDLDEDEDISLEIDDVNLDEIDADDIGSLEDFSDIEDLDDTLDIDEFSEDKDIEPEVKEKISIDDVNHDYTRFVLIQDSISAFYNDEKYESEFIENIFIADAIGVSSDMKKYLEEEMFLNVVIRKIELKEELSKMAKVEIS